MTTANPSTNTPAMEAEMQTELFLENNPDLFAQVDTMLRSHFGLPPVRTPPPSAPSLPSLAGVRFCRITGYWNTIARTPFADRLCAIIPNPCEDGVFEDLVNRDDVFHVFDEGEDIVGVRYDFTVTHVEML